jgi:ubiquitin-conjugating enzyme E2 variant
MVSSAEPANHPRAQRPPRVNQVSSAAAGKSRGSERKQDPNQEKIVVPRSFRLIDELEAGEKAGKQKRHSSHAAFCSYGIEDDDGGLYLSNWHGTIVGPQGENIYTLRMYCGAKYPDKPPKIWFNTAVNIPCVDQKDGAVTVALSQLKKWRRSTTLSDLLISLREQIILALRAKVPQPPIGTEYPKSP